MAGKKGICMRIGRGSIQRCVATGSIYGSQRGRLNVAMFITASVLLECPLWSSGFQIPFTRVNHGIVARPFSSSCLPCRFRDPPYKRARQVAVECKDGERRRGDTPADSPLPETRTMKWDDDAPRGTSNALDEKKSLRIAQLRAELQDSVRAEEYAEAAILQEQIQALERTVARQSFDQASSITRQATSSALVVEDESMLSRSRGPMQRRPSRTLQREVKPVLTDRERTREDEQSDALFYKQPRMVTHVDLKFALRLQQLYQKRLLPGSAVLDLGASCVSYLPEGVVLRDVVGLGMNMQELEANEDLTKRIVHDLNGTQFTCFTGTKLLILTQPTQFTCFTGTKLQILTQLRQQKFVLSCPSKTNNSTLSSVPARSSISLSPKSSLQVYFFCCMRS
jgi:hypothetical protein